MSEYFLISRQSNGGYSYKDVLDMDFDLYLETVEYADMLQRKNPEDT